VDKENREAKNKNNKTKKTVHISAPDHQLKRAEKHHQNLRDNPVGSPGASHEKAQLFSNKTHYNLHDPDARISVKPGKARKLNYHCSMGGHSQGGY
jgi:hypothetical protein